MSKHRMKVAFHVHMGAYAQLEEVATASSSGTAEWVSCAAGEAALAFGSQFGEKAGEFSASVHFWEVEEVDVSDLSSPREKLVTVSGSNTHEQQAEATGSAQFVADIISGSAATYATLHPVDADGPQDADPEADAEPTNLTWRPDCDCC